MCSLIVFGLCRTAVAQNNQQASLATGPSTSTASYLQSNIPGVGMTSIFSVPDSVPNTDNETEPYLFGGIPDGMGAYDNGDGTFTLLVHHEMAGTLGVPRAHGAIGAYITQMVIDKTTLEVISARDLNTVVKSWDGNAFVVVPAPANEEELDLRSFNRLCSADLPKQTALFNSVTGLGTEEKIFLGGEENAGGRAFAHVLTGGDARTAFHLPHLGRFSIENIVASPMEQDKTIVVGLDDAYPEGELYIYVGVKNDTGATPVERAGLVGGSLYGLRIPNKPFEVGENNDPVSQVENFELVDLGDVSGLDGAGLTAISAENGVTNFGRPEDGVWDPRPGMENIFYWASTGGVTDGMNTPTRLWKMEFTDLSQPELGGTMTVLLDASRPGPTFVALDNITMDENGVIFLQEDSGGSSRLSRIWSYAPDTFTGTANSGDIREIAFHSPQVFDESSPDFLTNNEESSGIIPLTGILGAGKFALGVQAHFSLDSETNPVDIARRETLGIDYETGVELVEGGQVVILDLSDATAGLGFENLVDAGEEWTYFIAGDPGAGWETSGFDDSSWSKGNAELGFNEGDEATLIDNSNPQAAYFFRKSFTLDSKADVICLDLFLKRDDGAVVYLNGREVKRDNMPDGSVTFSTLATAFAEDDGKTFHKFPISADSLVDGENIIAVSVHQSDVTSSDLSFDLGLSAVLKSTETGTPPAVPSDLLANVVAYDQIDVSFTDQSTDETGFLIERSIAGGPWEVVQKNVVPDLVTFENRFLTELTEYRYRARAFNVFGVSDYTNVVTAMTPEEPAPLITGEDFSNGDLGLWSSISLASNQDWEASTRDGLFFAEANGFGADEASDDWLISPRVNFNHHLEEFITFETIKGYDGGGFEVVYSTDYDGGGDPTGATWTHLSEAVLSDGNFNQVESGQVDLSGIEGDDGYIAFHYTSTGTGGGEGAIWRVLDVQIRGTFQLPTLNTLDFEDESFSDWSVVDLASDRGWTIENDSDTMTFFGQANGYGGSGDDDDWLISPALDLDANPEAYLNFLARRRFGDGTSFRVLVSTDYDGAGDPTSGTWTELFDATLPTIDQEQIWLDSGFADLKPFSSPATYVAFHYRTPTGNPPTRWRLDGVQITLDKPDVKFSGNFEVTDTSPLNVNTIRFTSTISGGEGALSYEWDFGDGKTSSKANPVHTYEDAGSYNVTLVITDEDENTFEITRSEFITVREATEEVPAENISALRVATYNVSLNRPTSGQLVADLSSSSDSQAQSIAEIIQLSRPDVILLNEFDYDEAGEAVESFKANYLMVSQNGSDPIDYPHVFSAASNTGIPSGFDFNNDGDITDPEDAFGFGDHPGQYGMVILSKYPIDEDGIRTFQNFLWKDMPGALLPPDPNDSDGDSNLDSYYNEDELEVFRLSSKSHWDVPVMIDGKIIHLLASHPTPPVFDDGTETNFEDPTIVDWNGRRNHDEIRFWADYIDPSASAYIYDDEANDGGLAAGETFIILGDLNADPVDGDSTGTPPPATLLLDSPFVDARFSPVSSAGEGNDTATFGLRADYLLHSKAGLLTRETAVYWPVDTDIRSAQFAASDHRMVYSDLEYRSTSDFTLQVLHSSDNESSFQDPNTLEEKILNYGALVEGLRSLAGDENIGTVYVTAGDHTLPGPFYEAAAQVPSLGQAGAADIAFYNAMGLTANGMGNHEFDGGIEDFASFLPLANYPFLSVNLDFSNVDTGDAPAIEIGVDGSSVTELAGKVARSAYVEINGEKIGLIGRAPADFFNVVADPEVTLPGLDFVGGREAGTNQPLMSALPLVLEQVDILKAQGINKIILLDHAQDFTGDPLSASELRDIDLIVTAGSTGFLAMDDQLGPFNQLRDGDSGTDDYPTLRDDLDGNPVLLVNSDQLYRYLGNLIIGFDSDGLIDFVDVRSGPIASNEATVTALGEYNGDDSLAASEEVQELWTALQETPLITELFEVVGTTETPLNGERADVRTRETNLARLVTDSTLWSVREEFGRGDLVLKNGGGIRDSITGPNITRLGVSSALAFNNGVVLVEVTAAELLATLENGVSRFPARDGRFPQLSGVTMEFDPTRPGVEAQVELFEPSRIGRLVVHRADGTYDVVVENFILVGDPARTFDLATNDFLLTGGDGYGALGNIDTDSSSYVGEVPGGERNILSEYISGPLEGMVDLQDPPVTPRLTRYSSGRVTGTYSQGEFDESSAEIVDYCAITKRLFISNASEDTIDVVDATKMELIFQITELGGSPNSVAVNNGVIAVAIQNDVKTDPGWVVFYDTLFGNELNRLEAGALPDMLTFSPDGSTILVANEGEPNDDYTVDPEGSISIINLGDGYLVDVVNLTSNDVIHLGFSDLDEIPFFRGILEEIGIRLFGQIHSPEGEFVRMSSIAEDLEPEYITISPDNTTAYVALQENNALAIIDLSIPQIVDLVPLGYKDHSLEGNGFDASNKDGIIDIRPHPTFGAYMPDAIDSYETLGETFVISSNEGDSRDYDGYSEEVRVDDLLLDPEVFPNAAELQDDANLGRLKTTTATGDYDGDGYHERIISYGTRSFSIWDASGNLVFDSGDQFEQIIADRYPEYFNASNDNASFDNRSDDKGPEPEGVVVGQIGDRKFAFIGLERMGGFMIYDVTFPYEPIFIDYVLPRDFSVDPEDDFPLGGDLGPEGLKFLSADIAPGGVPTLVIANEVSGTTTLHEITVPPAAGGYALQILHSSDNESAFMDPNTGEEKILHYGSVIENLRKLGAREQLNTIYLTAGDHTLPNPFYEASAEVPEFGQPGLADIAFYNAMGLTANGMGNHEFDGGIDEFAHMVNAANYPFIAANLDFSNIELSEETPGIEIGVDGASVQENAGKVCRSSHIVIGGEKVGLIGRAPADFFNVVADPDNTLPGLDFFGGRDPETNQPLESAVDQVLEQVDLLKGMGINKIILMDHAQDFTADPLSAQILRDIDILVTAGSTGFMASDTVEGPFNLLRDGDTAETAYPTMRSDMEGNPVLVVNSDQLYRYVGQLIVRFDIFGRIKSIDDRSGPVAASQTSAQLVADELELGSRPPQAVQDIWDRLKETDSISGLFEVVGETEFPLIGARSEVRSRETNLGRIAADSTLWYAKQFAEDESLSYDVDIALKNGGGIRDSILGPNITSLGIGSAFAFDNRLAILQLDATELLAVAENSVSRFPALDGRFPQLAGMEIVFDSSRPGVSDQVTLDTPSRIQSLVVYLADGSPDVVVADFALVGNPSRTFGLATNNFLATGGDGYAALGAISAEPSREVLETSIGEQEIFADYLDGPLDQEVSLEDGALVPRVALSSSAIVGNYAEWAADHFTVGDPGTQLGEDFDGDGRNNLFAYAFRLDPRSSNSNSNLPQIGADGSDLLVTLTVSSDPELALSYESSSDFKDWATLVPEADFTVESEVMNPEGMRSVTLRIPDGAKQGRYFLRARISLK